MTSAALLAVAATLAGALPPPPTQVVLTGRGSFGEVHFDHAAHLARHVTCVSCHGPGPVHEPELTPASAHATCRACHVEQQRGPTSCRECHVNVKDANGAGDPVGAATTVAGGPAATATATSSTSTSTIPSTIPWSRPDPQELAFRTALRAGLVSISGAARGGAGFAVGVDAEEGHRIAGVEVDWTSRPGAERTLALLGAGLALPLGGDVRARAVALCGVDTGAPAYVLPAVGARLGLELRGRGARSRLLPSADLSIAYLAALGARPAGDGSAREEALLFALRLGWELPPR